MVTVTVCSGSKKILFEQVYPGLLQIMHVIPKQIGSLFVWIYCIKHFKKSLKAITVLLFSYYITEYQSMNQGQTLALGVNT
jgi:hypothetical protein